MSKLMLLQNCLVKTKSLTSLIILIKMDGWIIIIIHARTDLKIYETSFKEIISITLVFFRNRIQEKKIKITSTDFDLPRNVKYKCGN